RAPPSMFLLLAAALLPGIEHAGTLSVLFATLGTAVFALAVSGRLAGDPVQRASTVAAIIVIGPFRLAADLLRLRKAVANSRFPERLQDWSVWIIPVGLGAVFVGLFAAANPLIESWLSRIDPEQVLSDIDLPRIGFWLLAASVAWPFIHVRARPFAMAGLTSAQVKRDRPAEQPDHLFSPAAILRALIVFNALFAVQTALDVVYLWGGIELPGGMTYAEYAHRGAYPLIVTALLAAAFVLAAMRAGSRSERVPAIRVLVYLWVGQNVLLVISAMLRLDLYVEVYSLTMLRVAAFVWMLLVAFGLALIVARIALNRSSRWLVSLNAAALAATLYVCSFINFPYVIASYNVAHSYELTGRGTNLDLDYLLKLGPHAIPAFDPLLAAHPDILHRKKPEHSFAVRVYRYNGLMQLHRKRMSDWRGWTLRDWRLMRDLDGRAELVVKHNGFTLRAAPPAWVLDELGLPPDNQPPDF
ncbi:MAG TPA: DUF4173 domain-containing protein, partial [Afifellaceae bacterium]|nr:DUF4173 domain-containing protein [Afifellaceae bacterium]